MNKSAYATIDDTDCIIHLVDVKDRVGHEEEEIIQKLVDKKGPVILGLNKVDLTSRNIPAYIELWERVAGVPVTEMKNFVLLPLSGKEGTNIDKLFDCLFELLPEGPALYPEDTLYDIPQRMVIADIVREKFLNAMHHEIPHSIAVIIEDVQPRKKKTLFIQAVVLVETESQKRIVIGKNGKVLKDVGTKARKDLEEHLEGNGFLEIFVKDKKKWRDTPSLLEEMGYSFM